MAVSDRTREHTSDIEAVSHARVSARTIPSTPWLVVFGMCSNSASLIKRELGVLRLGFSGLRNARSMYRMYEYHHSLRVVPVSSPRRVARGLQFWNSPYPLFAIYFGLDPV